MIVIDVGCATYPQHPEDESTMKLIERFKPSVYYGFDPHPSVVKTAIFEHGTRVLIEQKAAWTYDGFIGYTSGSNPLRATTGEAQGPAAVPCFDLAEFIIDLKDGRIVLKLDAEKAELTLLPHLARTGVDALLELLLIEWHCDTKEEHQQREGLLAMLACPVEEW